jgi:glutaredoxin
MKIAIVYTMKGCPHCIHIKEELNKNNLPFIERDIDDFESEYDDFTKIVQNEYVPAMMLITLDENDVVNSTTVSEMDNFIESLEEDEDDDEWTEEELEEETVPEITMTNNNNNAI